MCQQASKINEKEELDEADNLQTIFGQLFSQLRGVDYQKSFRGKKGQNLFYVDFAGEGSIDVGGPYREAITYACQVCQDSVFGKGGWGLKEVFVAVGSVCRRRY